MEYTDANFIKDFNEFFDWILIQEDGILPSLSLHNELQKFDYLQYYTFKFTRLVNLLNSLKGGTNNTDVSFRKETLLHVLLFSFEQYKINIKEFSIEIQNAMMLN